MLLKVATLSNHSEMTSESQWLEFGVPVPEGILFEGAGLGLFNLASGHAIQAEVLVSRAWPDGSVQFALIKCVMTLGSGEEIELALGKHLRQSAQDAQDKGGERFPELELEYVLTDQQDKHYSRKQSLKLLHHKGETNDCLQSRIELADGHSLCLEVDVHRAGGNKLLKLDVRIHNPGRSLHPGGCWDLGDQGSVLFKSFGVRFRLPEYQGVYLSLNERESIEALMQSIAIYQESSGGEHWNSAVHRNKEGKVPLNQKGYVLECDGESRGKGDRAQPVVTIKSGAGSLSLAVEHFWQNCPNAISVDSSGLVAVDFFPSAFPDVYELQGGESKTHTVYLDTQPGKSALKWLRHPFIPVIADELMHAFPLTQHLLVGETDPLRELIDLGLDEQEGFSAKAERIDEYGWRNFGDLYADHETHYQSAGEPPFVSHYNNQYDPVMGFAMQYLKTGRADWFHLMDRLARHVIDIDIYQTGEDRAEYNHGLFWHTDHYLDAHTATHRTFSRHNDTSSTPGQTGGGPGTEHCYATGLAWHHYLTGNARSRQAVLALAQWMVNLHEGGEGFLAKLSALKRFDLKRLKKLRGSSSTGFYRLPFTRGSGNYINVVLDAFMVSGDEVWMKRAEQIIRDTVHFQDDIEERNLSNIEDSWSYVIFLQAVRRYLQMKELVGEHDPAYWFARRTLMHYISWMVENEEVYLSQADTLEFPNATWVAQDVRKYWLLSSTLCYAGARSEQQKSKARYFMDYVTSELRQSPERNYTRIIVLLLQNYGWNDALGSGLAGQRSVPDSAPAIKYPKRPTRLSSFLAIVTRCVLALGAFSFKSEKKWLRAR